MAIWCCYPNGRGNLTLKYKNQLTGQTHQCGELRSDTPDAMIVDWVINKGDANPGDQIRLQNGLVLAISRESAEA